MVQCSGGVLNVVECKLSGVAGSNCRIAGTRSLQPGYLLGIWENTRDCATHEGRSVVTLFLDAASCLFQVSPELSAISAFVEHSDRFGNSQNAMLRA